MYICYIHYRTTYNITGSYQTKQGLLHRRMQSKDKQLGNSTQTQIGTVLCVTSGRVRTKGLCTGHTSSSNALALLVHI